MAKDEAPRFRCLLVHTLDLYERSATSRSPKVKVLKEALNQILSSAGWSGDVGQMTGLKLRIYIYMPYDMDVLWRKPPKKNMQI